MKHEKKRTSFVIRTIISISALLLVAVLPALAEQHPWEGETVFTPGDQITFCHYSNRWEPLSSSASSSGPAGHSGQQHPDIYAGYWFQQNQTVDPIWVDGHDPDDSMTDEERQAFIDADCVGEGPGDFAQIVVVKVVTGGGAPEEGDFDFEVTCDDDVSGGDSIANSGGQETLISESEDLTGCTVTETESLGASTVSWTVSIGDLDGDGGATDSFDVDRGETATVTFTNNFPGGSSSSSSSSEDEEPAVLAQVEEAEVLGETLAMTGPSDGLLVMLLGLGVTALAGGTAIVGRVRRNHS
jgi:hypothetical protein